jgi:hypothetical protein
MMMLTLIESKIKKCLSKQLLIYIVFFLLFALFATISIIFTTQSSRIDEIPFTKEKKSCAGCNGGPLKFFILLATFLYGTYYYELPIKENIPIQVRHSDVGNPRQMVRQVNDKITQKRKEDYQSHRRRMTMINDSFLK